MKKLILSVIFLTLTGCVAQDPASLHSRHYAYHASNTLNGNYRDDKEGTARLNLPVFTKMYTEGKTAKAKGITQAQAIAEADAIYKANLNGSIKQTYVNNPSKKYELTAEEKDSILWASELRGTYLDGYNGK